MTFKELTPQSRGEGCSRSEVAGDVPGALDAGGHRGAAPVEFRAGKAYWASDCEPVKARAQVPAPVAAPVESPPVAEA